MSELATQLVDRVIPHVPVRQWVLSLPWSLRYQLAFDASLCREVLAVFMRVVFGWLSATAARLRAQDRLRRSRHRVRSRVERHRGHESMVEAIEVAVAMTSGR